MTSDSGQGTALVIYESMFGNTQQVAEAIGEGIRAHMPTDVVEVGAAPTTLPPDVSFLVVGGPTHAFGMTRERTRADAASQASEGVVSRAIGIREWPGQIGPAEHAVSAVSFDTHIDAPRILRNAGSAARPIERGLRKLGFHAIADPEHFWVHDSHGPLREGEVDRARSWGTVVGERAVRA